MSGCRIERQVHDSLFQLFDKCGNANRMNLRGVNLMAMESLAVPCNRKFKSPIQLEFILYVISRRF
jgi:hypothetical protein